MPMYVTTETPFMTYAFDPTLADDVSLVRFHVGDTNPSGCYLQDETIQYWIDNTNEIGDAVIKCIRYIITQLSTPNFSLDWLSVSNEAARAGYEKLLQEKKIEFGIMSAYAASTISHPHRADSYEAESGFYSDPDGAP